MADLNFTRLPKRLDLAPSLARVESLGVNCELGLIQRHCSVENMGLFRFGMTPIKGLVAAVENSLDPIGDPADIDLRIAYSKEWLATSRRYEFEFHTEKFAPELDEVGARNMMAGHFSFLARKMREELEDADKLFVYRPEHAGPPSHDGMALLRAMRRLGPVILLWVDRSDDPAKIGTVEWTIPGQLLTGYLDRYTPNNYAIHASYDVWLRIIVRALEMHDSWRGWWRRMRQPTRDVVGI